ncbi:MAG: transposase [Patescibacteria group bacterium]|nr:transposase [Patescibacteria group bacterium]
MPSVKISKQNNTGIYFLTMTINRWYYIFDRHNRWDILAKSLQYCQKNKGVKIYGFVFMLNHIHLIVQSADVSGFVRDFKRFTSSELHKNLQKTEPSVLELFMVDDKYQFWQKTNMPKLIETVNFFENKLEYIHNNPVRKNYVLEPKYWYWSSANSLCELKVDDVES